jgi:glycosyltransferase involved in cell wall biosynthesis
LISIIIPAYNQGHFLSSCLESVLNQDISDWECIIINNGSTDNTERVCNSFCSKDKRFRYAYLEKPSVIDALNYGINNALGDQLTRLDADDIMPSGRLRIMSAKLIECGRGSLVTGNVKYFSDGSIGKGFKRYEKWINHFSVHEEYMMSLFIECVVPSPAWLMYTEDVKSIGGFEVGVYPEDYNFIFSILQNGIRIYKLNEIILRWRDHNKRASRISDKYKDQNFFMLKAKYFNYFYKEIIGKRKLAVWGAGKKGKAAVNALVRFGVFPEVVITSNTKKAGMCYKGIAVMLPDVLSKDVYFVISAVSSPDGINEIKNILERKQFINGKDWVSFCR